MNEAIFQRSTIFLEFFRYASIIFACLLLCFGCDRATAPGKSEPSNSATVDYDRDLSSLQIVASVRQKLNLPGKFAQTDFQQLVRVSNQYPDEKEVQELVAQAMAIRQDWDGLVELYKKQPFELRDHDKLVEAYVKAHRHDEAWNYLQEVIDKVGSTPNRMWFSALTAFLSDRNDEAERILTQLSLDAPLLRKVEILLLRGQLAARLEKWEEAEKWLRQTLELAPNDVSSVIRYGQVLRHLDRDKEASTFEARARKLQNDADAKDATQRLMAALANNLEQAWAKRDVKTCLKVINQMEPHADAKLKKVLDEYRRAIAQLRGD